MRSLNSRMFNWILVSFGAIAVVGLVIISRPVIADTSMENTITEKAKLNGIYNCYMNNAFIDEISSYSGTIVANPSYKATSLPFNGSANWTCKELLDGKNGSGGLKSMPKRTDSTTSQEAFLLGMGYKKTSSGDSKSCRTFSFETDNSAYKGDMPAFKVCMTDVTDGKITINSQLSIESTPATSTGVTGQTENHYLAYFSTGTTSGRKWYQICARTGLISPTLNGCIEKRYYDYGSSSSWQSLTNQIAQDLADLKKYSVSYMDWSTTPEQNVTVNFQLRNDNNSENTGGSVYSLTSGLDSRISAADTAIRYLSNNAYRGRSSLQLTYDEKIYLLQWYLENKYDITRFNESCPKSYTVSEAATIPSDYVQVPMYYSGEWHSCYVKAKNTSAKSFIYNSNGYIDGINTADFNGVVQELRKLVGTEQVENPDSLDVSNPGNSNNGSNTGSSGSGGGDSTISLCHTAASTLGWIVCPVIAGVSDALTGIYKAVVEPFLGIKASLLSTSGDEAGIYSAWKDFRNFTNVIFAIMFAVVIFAQITGFGISNYNVKKILPRLIAVAILVNISFFLCQILVDISNIAGSSLYDIFVKLAHDVDPNEANYALDGIVGDLSKYLATGVGLAAAGAGIWAAVSTWKIWLFPFLLAILGCIVSVLFFFIILGVRQAGVILMIAVAPIAIACYALPNTKSIFDRWKKIFVALLLVYPICGALMGGGKFAAALLVKSGTGPLSYFVAILVSVIPFFMIPSILKGAFAGLGNLGMRISNFGSRLGGSMQSGIRNSEGYRDWRRQQQMDYDAKVARNLLKKQASGKKLRGDQERRLQRHGAAYARAIYEDRRAGVNAETGDFNLPGTQSRLLMEQDLRDQRDATAVKNQQTLYESGNVVGNLGGEDFKVDPNSIDTLGDEYESQLGTLSTAIANGDINARREALTKVKALQNILSKTDAGRGIVQNRMSKMMMENGTELSGLDGQETALSLAAGHLMHDFGDTYKKANRGMHAMLGDLSQRQYSRGLTGGNSFERVSLGQDQRTGKERYSYRSSLYDTAGLGSYNPQTFGDADDEALSRIGAKIGTMSEGDVSTAVALANGALSGKNSTQLQDKIRRNFETIATGAYSRGAVGQSIDASTPTLGSSLLTQAENGTISSLIGRIQSTDPDTKMSDSDARSLAENARRALESGMVVKDADGLQQILTAVRSRGIRGIDGDEFNPVEPRDYKVPRGGGAGAEDGSERPSRPTIEIADNVSDADMERLRRERERRERNGH